MGVECELEIGKHPIIKVSNYDIAKVFLYTMNRQQNIDIVVHWDNYNKIPFYLHVYVKELNKCHVWKCREDDENINDRVTDRYDKFTYRINKITYKSLNIPRPLYEVTLIIFISVHPTECKRLESKYIEILTPKSIVQKSLYFQMRQINQCIVRLIKGNCNLCKNPLEIRNQFELKDCKHKFHESCITKCIRGKTKWDERPTCPICHDQINHQDYDLRYGSKHKCKHIIHEKIEELEIEDIFEPILFAESINDCGICLEPMMMMDYVELSNCHHEFHKTCILEAFKRSKNCPYCRRYINCQDFDQNKYLKKY